jgi:hypothetical protein
MRNPSSPRGCIVAAETKVELFGDQRCGLRDNTQWNRSKALRPRRGCRESTDGLLGVESFSCFLFCGLG